MTHATTVQPLRMTHGAAYSFRIEFQNDGEPFNITGSFIRVSFNRKDYDTVPLFTKQTPTQVEILNQATNLGQARVHLVPNDTQPLPNQQVVLYFDTDITTAEGPFSPLLKERLIVDGEVTT